jgi:23S rRNA (uridine2552-2'-O)-methyltransferase
MAPLADVHFIQGDFREQSVLDQLVTELDGARVDLVMSDMAPNITGTRSVDQPRAMYLAELALELVALVLKPGGRLVVKLFQGEGFDDYVRNARRAFKAVSVVKPKASRPQSREVYLVAGNYILV